MARKPGLIGWPGSYTTCSTYYLDNSGQGTSLILNFYICDKNYMIWYKYIYSYVIEIIISMYLGKYYAVKAWNIAAIIPELEYALRMYQEFLHGVRV